MKLTPKGCDVSASSRSSSSASAGAVRPARAAPSMPSPPACETAAASSGGAAAPIPACCTGTVQPTNWVNLVVSIEPPLFRPRLSKRTARGRGKALAMPGYYAPACARRQARLRLPRGCP